MEKEQSAPLLSEDSVEVLYSIAYQHISCGQFQEAEKLLYSIVMFAPKAAKYWKALAFVQQKQKMYDEAFATYALISGLNPKDPEPYLRAAECYFSKGEVVNGMEALKETEKRIKQSPQLLLEFNRLKEAWTTRRK